MPVPKLQAYGRPDALSEDEAALLPVPSRAFLPPPYDDEQAWNREMLVERAQEDDCAALLASDVPAWMAQATTSLGSFLVRFVGNTARPSQAVPARFGEARVLYGLRGHLLYVYGFDARRVTREVRYLRLSKASVAKVGPEHSTVTLVSAGGSSIVLPWLRVNAGLDRLLVATERRETRR